MQTMSVEEFVAQAQAKFENLPDTLQNLGIFLFNIERFGVASTVSPTSDIPPLYVELAANLADLDRLKQLEELVRLAYASTAAQRGQT